MSYLSFLQNLILSPIPFFHIWRKQPAEKKKEVLSYSLFFYVGAPLFLVLGFAIFAACNVGLDQVHTARQFARFLAEAIVYAGLGVILAMLWTWLGHMLTGVAIRLAKGKASPETSYLDSYLGARLYVLFVLFVYSALLAGALLHKAASPGAAKVILGLIYTPCVIWGLFTQAQASMHIVPAETGCIWWIYAVTQVAFYLASAFAAFALAA